MRRQGTSAAALATVTLDAYGNANFTSATLTAGSHTISADYSGDDNFLASNSSLAQLVSEEATSNLTLSSSANPALASQAVAFTVNASGTLGAATGTITFQDDMTVLGTATLDASGNTNFTLYLTKVKNMVDCENFTR